MISGKWNEDLRRSFAVQELEAAIKYAIMICRIWHQVPVINLYDGEACITLHGQIFSLVIYMLLTTM